MNLLKKYWIDVVIVALLQLSRLLILFLQILMVEYYTSMMHRQDVDLDMSYKPIMSKQVSIPVGVTQPLVVCQHIKRLHLIRVPTYYQR